MARAALLALVAGLIVAGCMGPAYVEPARTAGTRPVDDETVTGGGEAITAEGTEVLAEGLAALPAQGSEDIARDHAIRDALRKAVEQGVGTWVSSQTRVENFQLLSDRIYSKAQGYVSSYRIVHEGLEGAIYRAVVRANVKLNDIENDLAAIGILVREQGRPRTMVVVKELAGRDGFVVDDRMMSRTMLETRMVDRFHQKGFPVVDAATVQENLDKEELRLMLRGDDQTAVLVGLKAGAEVIVTGTAEHIKTTRLVAGAYRDFHSFRVSARAINTESAEVLAASATSTELPFSEDEARQRAADTTAEALIAGILGGWQKRENVTIIQADNADYARVQKLKSEIRGKLRGIITVTSRDLIGSTAVLEVVSETSSQEVLDGLGTRGLDIGIEVMSFSGNRIDIRFTDDGGEER